MTKKEKLKQLLEQVNSLEKKSLGMDEVGSLINRLKEIPAIKTFKSLEKINSEVDKFKTDFNLKPVIEAIKGLETELAQSEQNLRDEFDTKLKGLPQTPDLTREVEILQQQFEAKLKALEIDDIKKDTENLKAQLQTYIDSDIEEDKIEKEELNKTLNKLRTEINTRISNLGGGAMNRQNYINNVDPLKRYTDINWKAGSNVTLSYANNDQTKRVDITITATGGSGSGIVRSIQSIAIDTAADSAATTDYVYLCSGTLTLTLPDATTNTNLYTVKNVGTGVVTIATTNLQTIDGNSTITMATQFTSVDLISDTANWSIT